MLNQA